MEVLSIKHFFSTVSNGANQGAPDVYFAQIEWWHILVVLLALTLVWLCLNRV